MERKLPKIGTSLVIFNNKNQVLFGKRIYNPVGWSTPGGHIEFLENIEECSKREALEEIGVEVENLEIKTIGENIFKDKDFHTLTVYVFCNIKNGLEPINMEPEKCAGWQWFDIDNIPTDVAFNYEAILNNNKQLLKDYIKKHTQAIAA